MREQVPWPLQNAAPLFNEMGLGVIGYAGPRPEPYTIKTSRLNKRGKQPGRT